MFSVQCSQQSNQCTATQRSAHTDECKVVHSYLIRYLFHALQKVFKLVEFGIWIVRIERSERVSEPSDQIMHSHSLMQISRQNCASSPPPHSPTRIFIFEFFAKQSQVKFRKMHKIVITAWMAHDWCRRICVYSRMKRSLISKLPHSDVEYGLHIFCYYFYAYEWFLSIATISRYHHKWSRPRASNLFRRHIILTWRKGRNLIFIGN